MAQAGRWTPCMVLEETLGEDQGGDKACEMVRGCLVELGCIPRHVGVCRGHGLAHSGWSRKSHCACADCGCNTVHQAIQQIEALQKEGWKTDYTAVPLGTTGGITNNTVKTLTKKLKLTTGQADNAFRRLHGLEIQAAHTLVRKRRYQYHRDTRGTQSTRSDTQPVVHVLDKTPSATEKLHKVNKRHNKVPCKRKDRHQVGVVT